ncbi:hypothetical protein TGRUB_237195 [Toxoplasma gondii RUB]|uniref:Uncharacterized protein n=1 Tax=Toxoplasma gondii RUB TaxID=935652 RepID=A0A086M0D7_TOXGO|nr:hypothetical protein TGRUB_237195 [Toxoplasma gondii RUB]
MNGTDGHGSPEFGADGHSRLIGGDFETETRHAHQSQSENIKGQQLDLPGELQGHHGHSIHRQIPSRTCASERSKSSNHLHQRTSSEACDAFPNAYSRDQICCRSGEASPFRGTEGYEELNCAQRFFCPTFSCALPNEGSNNLGIDQATDPQTESGAETPSTPPANYENNSCHDKHSSASSQKPGSRGSSATPVSTPASGFSSSESAERDAGAFAESSDEDAFFGVVGGSVPGKHYRCVVLRRAIETMPTDTTLRSEINDRDDGRSSGASICEATSTSRDADRDLAETLTKPSFPFQDLCEKNIRLGLFEDHQERYVDDVCLDQSGRSLEIFPNSTTDYDDWALHHRELPRQSFSNIVANAHPPNEKVSQEVQTRLPERGSNASVQISKATADVKTQTKRADRCQRGVQCGLTKKLASFAYEELVNQHRQVQYQLETTVATVRVLSEQLRDAQRHKQSGLQRLEESLLFAEELQGLLEKRTSALSTVRADLEEQKETLQRLTAEQQTFARIQQSEKENTDREHHLVVSALQAQLKHTVAQLEQAEEEKRLEVSREVRKTLAAKEHAEKLDQQYTAELRHLQARYKEGDEAIKQAREEINFLRGELRERESQHARALHDTELQKDAERVHLEATQMATTLSIERELLHRSLELDRLRAKLVRFEQRLNSVQKEHLLEVQGLKQSHQEKLQQMLLEHRRALDSQERYAQQLREMVAMGKEDLASEKEFQRQLWTDKTARLQSDLEQANARDRQSAKTIAALKLSAESYKKLAGELQSELQDKIARGHHREAELAILRCDREELLHTLQTSAAEYRAFREEATMMKMKLLSAIDDKEETLRQAEARLVDELTVLQADMAQPAANSESCTHATAQATRESNRGPETSHQIMCV